MRPIRCAYLLLALAGLAVAGFHGYLALFSIFRLYDDEGTLMIAISQFNKGLPLYDHVYSQYGPFHSLWLGLLYRMFKNGVTNDAARWITLFHWIIASSALGFLVYRLTNSLLAACITFLETVLYLTPLTWEPGATHGPLAALISLVLAVGALAGRRPGSWATWAAIGALTAAVALTKINVGVYLFLAVAFSVLICAEPTPLVRFARRLLGLCIVVMPAVIMRAHLKPNAGTFNYCTVVTISSVCLLLASKGAPRSAPLPFRVVGALLGGFTATAVSGLAIMLMLGTTLPKLLDGIVLGPLRHPGIFYLPYKLPSYGLACVAALAPAICLAFPWTLKPLGPGNGAGYLGGAKIALGGFALYQALDTTYLSNERLLALFAPLAWLVLLPGTKRTPEDSHDSFLRMLLAATATLQTLHAYPVAGTHRYLATFLLIPTAMVVLCDGLRMLRQDNPKLQPFSLFMASPHRSIAPMACALAAIAAFAFFVKLPERTGQYKKYVSLGLPGAERIRLDGERVATYNLLANNLRAYSETFVTIPGFNSFYFWTGLLPPTANNAGDWMMLFDDAKQREIVAALRKYDRICFIFNSKLLAFWCGGSDVSQKPLVRYLLGEFQTMFQCDDGKGGAFQFRIPKDWDKTALPICLLSGQRRFAPESDPLPLPKGLFMTAQSFTLSLWFRSQSPGVLLGMQNDTYPGDAQSERAWILKVTHEGKLAVVNMPTRAFPSLTNAGLVNDNQWRHLALVQDGRRVTVYLDGRPAAEPADAIDVKSAPGAQLGAGLDPDAKGTGGRWSHFSGMLGNTNFFRRPLTALEIDRLWKETRPQ